MNILALDLGRLTGWALSAGESVPVIAGTWELESEKGMRYARKLRMDRRLDPRVMALLNNLGGVHRQARLGWIFFEDVKFANSQAQAHLWASFRGAIWAFAHLNGIECDCLNTASLKKFATGNGHADKPAMMAALVSRFPKKYAWNDEKTLVKDLKRGILLDDNATDALHLLSWAHTLLK